MKKEGNKELICGVWLNSTFEDSLLADVDSAVSTNRKFFIVTPNPEFIVYADKHPWFKNILNSADVAIPDGVGLVLAGFLKGIKLTRITGVDLMEKIIKQAMVKGRKIYLLGGSEGAAVGTAEKLKVKSEKLKVDVDEGGQLILEEKAAKWSQESEKRISDIVARINKVKPDYLFVALGMGKQEKFIYDNLDKLNIKVAMGVGGAFDYLSRKAVRAPLIIRKVGFEWLFRLLMQPWRWRRQLNLLKFCRLVVRNKGLQV